MQFRYLNLRLLYNITTNFSNFAVAFFFKSISLIICFFRLLGCGSMDFLTVRYPLYVPWWCQRWSRNIWSVIKCNQSAYKMSFCRLKTYSYLIQLAFISYASCSSVLIVQIKVCTTFWISVFTWLTNNNTGLVLSLSSILSEVSRSTSTSSKHVHAFCFFLAAFSSWGGCYWDWIQCTATKDSSCP